MAVLTLKSEEFKSFPEIMRDFAAHKSVIENCSEKTVCEYLYDLRTFFRFLIATQNGTTTEGEEFENTDISRVDLEFLSGIRESDIYAFLNFVANDRNNGWAARGRKITSLKSFFKFVVKTKKWLKKDPTADIEGPKRQVSLPKYLTLDESLMLLSAVKNDEASKTVLRDYAIITLFLNCGMRVSELVSINLTDLRPGLVSLTVIGKGHKERVVYLNDACKAALIDYIRERQEQHKSDLQTPALFISGRGERISVKTVQHIVYKYLDAAGLGGRGFSVHKLRHTAATLMYQCGKVDVRVLKDILGHEQLNTTQIYTHVSNENMKNAMDKNPLSEVSIHTPEEKE